MKNKAFLKPGCMAAAVAILGDKWSPLLIRSLSQKTMRFCQLQDETGGINPRTLSAKLLHLENEGIITKAIYPQVPPRTEYSLTRKGKDLLPILYSMADWGKKYGPRQPF